MSQHWRRSCLPRRSISHCNSTWWHSGEGSDEWREKQKAVLDYVVRGSLSEMVAFALGKEHSKWRDSTARFWEAGKGRGTFKECKGDQHGLM